MTTKELYLLRYTQGATTTTEKRVVACGRINRFATAIQSMMDPEDYNLYRTIAETEGPELRRAMAGPGNMGSTGDKGAL
jgi:hypothetical protein